MLTSLKIRSNNLFSRHPKITLFILITLLGFILTTIFTWPMLFKLPVFYSDESDYTLIGWIMWYNQLSFTSGRIFTSTDYFNAFQFYPWPYALAFSENMFLPSILFSPIYWLTNQLVLSVNLYTFSTFILTFISSFYVFRKLLKDTYAAVIAATIFCFNPVTASHFPGHTHLLGKFFLPLLFLSAVNFLIKPSNKNSLLFGLFFTLNALTSINLFIISVPSLFLFAIPFIIFNMYIKNWIYFKKAFLSGLVCLIYIPLFIHFLLPYLNFSKLENAQRGVDESIFFSAESIDWVLPFPESLIYKEYVYNLDPIRSSYPRINYSEHTLGLNIFPFTLFLIGLFYINKQKIIPSKILISALLLMLVGTLIFTFGPIINGNKSIYYYFNDLTGLLNGIRVPTRFQFLFYIPFSIFAGIGFLIACQKMSINKILVFSFFLLIITIEGFNQWNFISDTSSLTDNPPVFQEYRDFTFLKDSTTLHFPIYTKNFEKQIYYLQLSTLHSERLVNGYSGYFPPDWVDLITAIEANLDQTTLTKLSVLKVNYLVFHKDRLDNGFITQLKEKNNLITDLTYFENSNYLILDLKKLSLSTNKCYLSKDISLNLINKSASFGEIPAYFNQFKISNNNDCYFTNILNQRYLETTMFISGKFYPMSIRMPAVLGPKEEILLK